jgi:hypothetical protein
MAVDINSIIRGFVDRGIWYYYDTATVAQGASTGTSIPFFASPISATKSKLLTNMTLGNQFPPPRCLVLDNIGFYFSTTMLKADIDLFLDNCFMEFRIDDKIFFEGHLWRYASGYGLVGTSTKTNEAAWNIGLPDVGSVLRFGNFAKYIAPQQLFSLNLTFPTAQTMTTTANGGVGARIVTVLQGLTDRSVQ